MKKKVAIKRRTYIYFELILAVGKKYQCNPRREDKKKKSSNGRGVIPEALPFQPVYMAADPRIAKSRD